MTGVALAINASAGSPSYAARAFRNSQVSLIQWDGDALGGRQGVRPMGGTAIVTLSGSTITVNLHAGNITPGWASVTSTYQVALTAVETHTLTPADATNPRKDIVIGRVYDHDESASGQRLYRSEYIAGTAGPGPSEPAVPQGAIRLATIDVPQVSGGSPAVTVNNLMTVSTGGVLPVRSVTERAGVTPYDGDAIYRRDRDWIEIHDGTAWRVQGVAVCTSTTDRDSASGITNPYAGEFAITTDTRTLWVYTGSAWAKLVGELLYDSGNLTTTAGAAWTTSTKVDTGMKGTFTAISGVKYEVDITVHGANTLAQNYATVGLLVKNGGLPANTDTQVSACSCQIAYNQGVVNLSHKAFFTAAASATYGVGLFGWIDVGTGSGSIFANSTGFWNRLTVRRAE